MTKYSKPVITVDAGMAEGVYAASGCLVGRIADESYEGGMGNKYRLPCIILMKQKNTAILLRQ